MNKNIILGIECAGQSCSVAVLSDDKVIGFDKVTTSSGYPEILVPMIEKCIKEAKISYFDISVIASSAGAGSFTGVRIGLASALGISLVTKAKITGISNFIASAFTVSKEVRSQYDAIISVIDPRREDFYIQLLNPDLSPISEPQALFAEEVPIPQGKVLLVGDACSRFKEARKDIQADIVIDSVPDAKTIALYALSSLDNLPPPIPLYVSPANVSC